MYDFKDRVVLVTGGSRGIGAAVAKGFAELSAKVVITYRTNKQSAEKLAKEILSEGGECLVLRASVESQRDVRRSVQKVHAKFGRIDVLVNNAAIWKMGEIGSMSEAQWDETMAVNLKGTFLFCNEVAPIMKKQKSGKIVNVSSTAGQRGEPFHSHYAASKGGLIAFTKSIAVELAPYNINVNCISPGWVATDMTKKELSIPRIKAGIDSSIPKGKVADPRDIVGSVLFLASDFANHIIGATISVNGGSVLF